MISVNFANKLRLFFGVIFLLLSLLIFSTASLINSYEKVVVFKDNVTSFKENLSTNIDKYHKLWRDGDKAKTVPSSEKKSS